MTFNISKKHLNHNNNKRWFADKPCFATKRKIVIGLNRVQCSEKLIILFAVQNDYCAWDRCHIVPWPCIYGTLLEHEVSRIHFLHVDFELFDLQLTF